MLMLLLLLLLMLLLLLLLLLQLPPPPPLLLLLLIMSHPFRFRHVFLVFFFFFICLLLRAATAALLLLLLGLPLLLFVFCLGVLPNLLSILILASSLFFCWSVEKIAFYDFCLHVFCFRVVLFDTSKPVCPFTSAFSLALSTTSQTVFKRTTVPVANISNVCN